VQRAHLPSLPHQRLVSAVRLRRPTRRTADRERRLRHKTERPHPTLPPPPVLAPSPNPVSTTRSCADFALAARISDRCRRTAAARGLCVPTNQAALNPPTTTDGQECGAALRVDCTIAGASAGPSQPERRTPTALLAYEPTPPPTVNRCSRLVGMPLHQLGRAPASGRQLRPPPQPPSGPTRCHRVLSLPRGLTLA